MHFYVNALSIALFCLHFIIYQCTVEQILYYYIALCVRTVHLQYIHIKGTYT